MTQARKSSIPVAWIALQATLGLGCIGLAVFGAIRAGEPLGLACLVIGVLGIVILAALVPLLISTHDLAARMGPSHRSGANPSASQSAEHVLSQILENSMLSDNAKRVLFRDRELELLRRAIEDDIAHGDYNSGLTLCDDMANLFGHREEAEAYRNRILQANHAAFEARVHEALHQLDQLLALRDWAVAYREAASIRRLYPNHHLVQDVDQRILRARDDHKRQLEMQFIDAAQRDDVEEAMTLMKELDRYLTPDEGARLAETAQNVVARHRENLITRFKMAVNDHQWAQAAQIGNQIMAEHPNTKMADEVRSMIDVLRVRASQVTMTADDE